MRIDSLCQSIDKFNKLAGVIQVPKQFTQEVSDWAVSVFASRMTLVIDTKLEKIANEISICKEISGVLDSQEAKMVNEWDAGKFVDYLLQSKSFIIEFNDHRAKSYNFKLWLVFNKNRYSISFENEKQNFNHDNISQKSFIKKLDGLLRIVKLYFTNLTELYEDMLPTKETLVDLHRMKKLCQNNIKEYIDIDETSYFEKTFEINVDELPYLSKQDLEKIVETSFDITAYYLQTQEAADAMHKDLGPWKGMWHRSTIFIYVNHNKLSLYLDEASFKEKLLDIRNVIRHEIQHAMQQFVSRFKEIKERSVGLPPKKMRDKLQPNEDYVAKYYATEHELRDTEFYTNLTDNIEDFKDQVKSVPPSLRRDYARMWIDEGPIDIFPKKLWAYYKSILPADKPIEEIRKIIRPQAQSLKPKNPLFFSLKKDPAKYIKAVKVFWSAISGLI